MSFFLVLYCLLTAGWFCGDATGADLTTSTSSVESAYPGDFPQYPNTGVELDPNGGGTQQQQPPPPTKP